MKKTKKRKAPRKFWLVEWYLKGYHTDYWAYASKEEAKKDSKIQRVCNYTRVRIIEVREVVKRRKR